MKIRAGIVKEIRLSADGQPAAWIECPPAGLPQPGQYLLGWATDDLDAALAVPLFPGELAGDGFLAAGIPASWQPGTPLELRGPLGRGFDLPATARRLAVGAIGGSLDRLLCLIRLGMERDMAITLYADRHPAHLPSAVEIYPLTSLPEALAWADLLALDLDRTQISRLRTLLTMDSDRRLPCLVQALVRTALTCGGVADCGACAVAGRRHWKAACKDGPVFALNELDW
jgi:NAD(P)H-flavin reductase